MIACVVLDMMVSLPGFWKDLRGAERSIGHWGCPLSVALQRLLYNRTGPPGQVDDVSELGQAKETQDVAGL